MAITEAVGITAEMVDLITIEITITEIVIGAITGITILTGIAGRAARTTSVCPDRVPGGHGWVGGSLRISRRGRSSPAEASAPLRRCT
ncbi:hypothetical protein Rmet_6533 [Cupriavidus metallidurans CH34]|uniref:Uncharacterized protein n=1 Tax=Cupriavidus metallidurans (strain ATCC 43123 / DSM 2839 / NBRC 102507 / CH34) TaxID=266264 RepID=D3DXX0_CUPMC|nr:hypothetical protein Rmet_6533 [Cupriavidus metallidurans CH34]